jgi:peroxisomal membrane protein 4
MKGILQGFKYGSKLRFAHAFVISILFGKGTVSDRFKWSLRMALNHGTLLAIFAFTYKTICCILRNVFKM